jgi:hypothetical protein
MKALTISAHFSVPAKPDTTIGHITITLVSSQAVHR